MNEQRRSIYSYSGPGRALLAVWLLLLFAAVICAATAIRGGTARPQPPAPFDALDAAAQGAVYLDVVGVSDPMCPGTPGRSYYLVEDGNHFFRIACLTDEELAALGAQRLYWNAPEAEAVSSRLLGVSVYIPETVRESIMSVFELDDLGFDNNFGARCFLSQAPEERGNAAVWARFALIFALGFALSFALWLWRFFALWPALVRLEEEGRLDAAADELVSDATLLLRGDRLRLGEHYLFGWRNGLAAAWEDVVWCYGRTLALGSAVLARLLVIATADGKRHRVLFAPGEEKALRQLTAQLRAHNGDILLGDSAENRAAWEKACR